MCFPGLLGQECIVGLKTFVHYSEDFQALAFMHAEFLGSIKSLKEGPELWRSSRAFALHLADLEWTWVQYPVFLMVPQAKRDF